MTLRVTSELSVRVTLLAPGCFSPISESEAGQSRINDAQTPADINAAVAVPTVSQSHEQALAVALGQPSAALGELPIAQCRYLIETGRSAPEHCVCAELIHLQADKDNARLLPYAALSISETESTALIESLNQLINPDNLRIESTGHGRYYLCGMPAGSLDTWPAHAVANGKIANYLPRDAQAGDWRRLMTEVQMLFHSHPVNTARVAAGKLPVNAMWFWGGGKIDSAPVDADVSLVADDTYVCGLADQLELSVVSPNAFKWDALAGHVVIVNTDVYDAWLSGNQNNLIEQKKQLQSRWILPAQQAVANGQISQFVLDGCDGQAIVETQPASSASRFAAAQPFISWFKSRRAKHKANQSSPKADK